MTLLALDTATLYYRNFYALPETLVAPDGFPNNAVRGTLTMVANLVHRWRTSDLAACWDADWRPQWRVDLVPSYKTHRLLEDATEDEPDTLGPQIGALADIFDALGVHRPAEPDFEADDVIGSLARRSSRCVVVTSDRDLVQLIDGERVRVHLMTNGGMDGWPVLTAAAATERFGVPPDRYVDMAALRGDASDGLPGAPGIGTKTAVALITAFDDLDGVIRQAAEPIKPMTPRIAGIVHEHAAALRNARRVSEVVSDLPVRPRPWSPKRIQPRALSELASEWGVERQVDALTDALQTQHHATA